ncbi:nuclear transport factor 2 family protein [Desertivirga arenae]|uniref:nuclear transport factor 2 family protein n=1 Tax=Desertivirga arenae TaxID=2810309 RepID=UPI001A978C8E|nr:nuclear transport factor 2 family protein [Pedobacter sp. SYSU D00823]
MKKLFYSVLMLSLLVLNAKAQTKAEKQVASAVEQLKKAMVDGKKEDLEAIASEYLSYGHSGGKVEDKTAFVEAISSGKSDFVTIDLTEQTIKISGKTAIVRHKLNAQTNDSGKPGSVNLSILLVFAKEHGKWKLLARQAVRPPAAS